MRTRQDYDDSRDEEVQKVTRAQHRRRMAAGAVAFRIVQQSSSSLAGYIEASGDIAGDEDWEEYATGATFATVTGKVYAKARYDHTTVDTLLSLVALNLPRIIKRRREELAGIRVCVGRRAPQSSARCCGADRSCAPAKDRSLFLR